MNELKKKFPNLEVLAFPSNQFGHQCNEDNAEVLSTLTNVRPGNGFQFLGRLFCKVKVNGNDAHPLFKFMKRARPIPDDPEKDSKGNGVNDSEVLVLSRAGFDNTTVAVWHPICRNDIAWNFEKFLVDQNGKVVYRFSRYFPTSSIASYIEKLEQEKN